MSRFVVFGEVLFDHFPDGSRVLGGAPFNVAWHLQAFEQAPLLISRIGDDEPGREIVRSMQDWGMDTGALQLDLGHPTGRVNVVIQDGEPKYDIEADCAYDFIEDTPLISRYANGILYHGSLAIRNPAALATLQAVKAKHRGNIFVDVNLRAPWWQPGSLFPLLHAASWVKLNEAELAELYPAQASLEQTMQAFCAEYDLETLIVTRGPQGAVACDSQNRIFTVQPCSALEVVDTVGAGDAFAAVLMVGFSKGWPLESTLAYAQDFAGSLIGRRGATVAERAFYRAFLENWH
jgi:fructokinase